MLRLEVKYTPCPAIRKDIINESKKLLQDKLMEAGLDGEFVMKLGKRVDPRPVGPVYLRQISQLTSASKPHIDMILRPGGGATNWTWALHVGPKHKTEDVYMRLLAICDGKPLDNGSESERQEPEPASKSIEETYLAEGCIYDAKIIKIVEFGVIVRVPKAGVDGIVPTKEWFGKHNPKLLQMLKPGTETLVMLFERSNPPKFSKIAADIHIENNRGRYTGLPDKAGQLDLTGFSGSRERMYRMLRWLAECQLENLGRPMDKRVAAEYVVNRLMAETGATKVHSSAVHGLIRAMATESYNWWVDVTDTGYSLTSTGMREADSKSTAPAPVMQPAEPVEQPKEAPTVAEPSVPEPAPVEEVPVVLSANDKVSLDLLKARLVQVVPPDVREAALLLVEELGLLRAKDNDRAEAAAILVSALISIAFSDGLMADADAVDNSLVAESGAMCEQLKEADKAATKALAAVEELRTRVDAAMARGKAVIRKKEALRHLMRGVLPDAVTATIANLAAHPEGAVDVEKFNPQQVINAIENLASECRGAEHKGVYFKRKITQENK